MTNNSTPKIRRTTIVLGGIVVILLAVLIGILMATKINNDKLHEPVQPASNATSKTTQKQLTVQDVATALRNKEMTVSEPQTAYYQYIGASSGYKLVANVTTTVEYYQFKDEAAFNQGVAKLNADDVVYHKDNVVVLVDGLKSNPTSDSDAAARAIRALMQ
jgi:hypothetical protein